MINLIVPIHNEFPYLKRCFDSITRQMTDVIRVILVDDHSTDGSKKYARGRSDNEGWLLLDTLPHEHGVSCARNKGLEAISVIGGSDEWVTFLDSDDELVPNAFDIMRKTISENPEEEWDSDDFGEPHNLGYFNLSECMTVIGNINENPELLEHKG